MPIVVEHQPPLNIVGGVAYDAGVMEGVAQRREDLFNRSMQAAQLATQQRGQNLNLLGQQQQQAHAAAMAQNDAVWKAQMQQQAIAAQQASAQQEMMANRDLYGMRDASDMAKMGRAHEFSVLESAHKSRAELESLIGGVDESRLTPSGMSTLSKVRNDLAELTTNLGTSRPVDYLYGLQEIAGRASMLKLPWIYDQTPPPSQQIQEAVVTGPDGRGYYQGQKGGWEKTGQYNEVNGRKVGEVFADPVTGSVGAYTPAGRFEPIFKAPEQRAKLLEKIQEEMGEELSSAMPNAMPTWSVAPQQPGQPSPKEIEIARRFEARWELLTGDMYRNLQQQQPSSPEYAGEGGSPMPPPDSPEAPAAPPAPRPQDAIRAGAGVDPAALLEQRLRGGGGGGAAPGVAQPVTDQQARVSSYRKEAQPQQSDTSGVTSQDMRRFFDDVLAQNGGNPMVVKNIEAVRNLLLKYGPTVLSSQWNPQDRQALVAAIAEIKQQMGSGAPAAAQ